jgi:hypothetical protein
MFSSWSNQLVAMQRTAGPPACCTVARVLPLVIAQRLDNLLTQLVRARLQPHEYLRGNALTLTDEPEQDVLSADAVVIEQCGLVLS